MASGGAGRRSDDGLRCSELAYAAVRQNSRRSSESDFQNLLLPIERPDMN